MPRDPRASSRLSSYASHGATSIIRPATHRVEVHGRGVVWRFGTLGFSQTLALQNFVHVATLLKGCPTDQSRSDTAIMNCEVYGSSSPMFLLHLLSSTSFLPSSCRDPSLGCKLFGFAIVSGVTRLVRNCFLTALGLLIVSIDMNFADTLVTLRGRSPFGEKSNASNAFVRNICYVIVSQQTFLLYHSRVGF